MSNTIEGKEVAQHIKNRIGHQQSEAFYWLNLRNPNVKAIRVVVVAEGTANIFLSFHRPEPRHGGAIAIALATSIPVSDVDKVLGCLATALLTVV